MYRIWIIAIVFLVSSCGTLKQNTTPKSSDNTIVLPPNTASNKYSKMRQN